MNPYNPNDPNDPYNPYNSEQGYRQRRVVRVLIRVLVILVVLSGIIFAIFDIVHTNQGMNVDDSQNTPVSSNVTISVGVHPTIRSKGICGTVMVKAGPANRVTLTENAPQDDVDGSANVLYDQDRATNTITLNSCPDILTVPSETNLALTGNGSVFTVIGVSGTMNLKMNGGLIELLQTTLEGRSKIETNGGFIVFMGQLARESGSDFSCNSGTLDITLPEETSYNLHVSGIVGSFITNIPGVQVDMSEADMSASDVPPINVGSQPSYATLGFDLNSTRVMLRGGSF